MQPIYLDANATTPLLPEVADAMRMAEVDGFGNPASQHFAGRRSRRVVEDAREAIAKMLGARVGGRDPDRVIFTSGGTEANNLAMLGLAGSKPGQLIISTVEHASIRRVAEHWVRRGRQTELRVDCLPVDTEGVVQSDRLCPMLSGDTRLVSVMLANHETGVLQPVRQLAKMSAASGVLMHTDAVQAVGKLPVDFQDLGVAAMSVSAHKLHGPKGIGALIVQAGVPIEPIHFGGHQQAGLRPGTEPVALVVGMYRAIATFHATRQAITARMVHLRQRFEQAIVAGWPRAVVLGAGAERLPNVSAMAPIGVDRQALVMALDQAGIACSTGSACASGSSEPAPTLAAMGCPRTVVECTVRFSLSRLTTVAEVDEAVRRILRVCHRLAAR